MILTETFGQNWDDIRDRSAYRRAWNLCMLQADVAAFSEGLKAAIPGIRFLPRAYWDQFVDLDRWNADIREDTRRRQSGLPSLDIRRHMRDPAGEPLRYLESFVDPAESYFLAWVEPPGWRPVWGPETDNGLRFIQNTPRLWFEFHRGGFLLSQRRIPAGFVEPRPANARETVCLKGERFEVRWNPNEPEAEAFGKKVYNILRRLTVWRFIAVECDSRKSFYGKPEGMQRQCLAGRHADAWTLERRHNYLACGNTPTLLKSARYRFRPGAVFTKAGLRQWQAEEDRLFEERLRLHMEAYERFRGVPHDFIEFASRDGKLLAARARVYERASSATAKDDDGPERGVMLELRIRRRRGRLEWA